MPIPSTPNTASSLGLEALMFRYQQADEEAARALIELVVPRLLRYFVVQASTRRFANDLLQDTWMRIHRRDIPTARGNRSSLGCLQSRSIRFWTTAEGRGAWSFAKRSWMSCLTLSSVILNPRQVNLMSTRSSRP